MIFEDPRRRNLKIYGKLTAQHPAYMPSKRGGHFRCQNAPISRLNSIRSLHETSIVQVRCASGSSRAV